ncbi:MAG: two-component sensor histidine kinase [Pseudonocardia sp. SCN 73-27]|uniref:HAMP domain-containing sensor histidine kinase n=1 Tax=unclassified Pseudonocardia TaxID=2619320 RepID=UPI00086C3F5E|nr:MULTISPECIES: HAMP domain-containing sensor histidine kinase [unclassified Pseudonocardia]ODU23307.1 MAG: two-component sensor histidine kinase [Pseudonocardia sp. SCN 72-51]ODV07890.1 MAG: two-component sensor histidine kinase [Pseudonocardia sp. SCN 73-27]
MTRPRTSLAFRVTASCLLVAVVAVVVAALVGLRLVGATARQVTRDVLAQQADVVAAQLASSPGGAGLRSVVQVLQGQDIAVVGIGDGLRLPAPATDVAAALRRADVDRAVTGTPVSAVVESGKRTWIVEARPTPAGAFALARTTDTGPLGTGLIRRNLAFALLAGAGVALLVGGVVGTLLARPLRRTASAARSLRTGRRDVRVPVAGPGEVAEVAAAVNELADALSHSEGRQREFLLSVSHELRTPLTAVRGFAESLADGVVTGDDARAAGTTILQEAQRLDRLVADLMELARLEADDFRLDMGPVDLVALLGEAASVWRARCAAAGVDFVLQLPPQPVLVHADLRRLRQVVDALAENALRLVPPGAPLVLAARPGTLEVRDGGPGLAPDDAPHVFRRGALHERYRGHRPVGAGGVGLALVHGLVTRMGADITASPAPEGGACFTVSFAGSPASATSAP